MKLRHSLCMAIVVRKNRWLCLFYRVDKDMIQLDRIHLPTRKIEGRCRFWILCKHVRAPGPIIQRIFLSRVPCPWGCIDDGCVLIIQTNVSLCVNSEKKDPGYEDGEQANVDDHGWGLRYRASKWQALIKHSKINRRKERWIGVRRSVQVVM
jgi:hypothetical protein